MKIEIRLHLDIDEEDVDYKGQELLNNVKDNFEEAFIGGEFVGCKVVEVKFVGEE